MWICPVAMNRVILNRRFPHPKEGTMTRLIRLTALGSFLLLAVPVGTQAQEIEFESPERAQLIESAMSAAPESVSADATVLDWNLDVIREGTNDWTCLPDRADTPGTDPWCVNEPWLNFLKAYVAKEEPSYEQVGIAYMLQGDTPVSNTDPYATEKTTDEDWVEDLGAHLMVLVPDIASYSSLSTDPENGGPWIMWPDTPYAHIMIPLEGAPK